MSVSEMMQEPQQQSQPQAQKRPRDDDVAPSVTTPKKPIQDDSDSTPLTSLSSFPTPRTPQPAPIQAPVFITQVTPNMDAIASSTTTQQPAKRRKLTAQEKEEQQREKDAKAKAKAEEKAKKDAEREADDKAKAALRAQKEEEKRAKDDEKRKKAEEREEKKRAKELEQQQKEEAKRKKEQAQPKLQNFFKKSATSATPVPVAKSQEPVPNASSTSADSVMQDADVRSTSPQKAVQGQVVSEYRRYFLPFELLGASIMAPYNHYMDNSATTVAAQSRLEQLISSSDKSVDVVIADSLRETFPQTTARGLQTISIAEIVNRVNGSASNPVDLTSEGSAASKDPLQLLNHIPMKYLHFPEDHRPAYWGTYTKPCSPHRSARLAKNPFARDLPETDYDYDSEGEWEEQGEGEDLDSEGDEDLDDGSEDEMDDFLDDEDDAQAKRRLISGDLEPISTGLCWQDPQGMSRLNDGSGAISTEFNDFKMGFLLESQPRSIDPFSTAYWTPEPMATTTTAGGKDHPRSMHPPSARVPLAQRPANNSMLNLLNGSNASGIPGSRLAKPVGRLVPDNMLPAVKQAIDGSDLTKIALIEHLKKLFPGTTKDAITNTIKQVAQRVGAKEVEKRWVLNGA